MTLFDATQGIASLQSFHSMVSKHFALKRRFTPTIVSSGDEQLAEYEENPDVGQLASDLS